MTSKGDSKPLHIKIFDLDQYEKLLKGVTVATCMLTEPKHVVDEESVIKRVNALTLGGLTGGDRCSCCGAGPFESRFQQTAHYKHHWHTYNLKRRLFGKPPLTLFEFNNRQDENSSVSGSESEVEDNINTPGSELFAAATRHCKAFFTNGAGQVFCIYRCVLHHRKEELSTDGEGKIWVQRCKQLLLPGFQRWAVLMVSGGHFAGAIFSGSSPALHKTMHSYVVRRGHGQAQGTRDQHGNAPRSAGASLRRFNQAQFIQHIQDILVSWSEDLKACSLILYRAVGPTNQGALFGKGSPITRDDTRVRALPFPTRKPTYKEVQRAHAIITDIEIYESRESFQKALVSAKTPVKPGSDGSGSDRPNRKTSKISPTKPIDRAKSREPVPRQQPTFPIQVTSSEDEGPCFIDSETPVSWIKTLSEQSSNGIVTNSRKDLLIDNSIGSPERSDSEVENLRADKTQATKKKKKKKQDDNCKKEKEPVKKAVKIPASLKKMWKLISEKEENSLETILEKWECEMGVEEACNIPDPGDGNTALHKAAIASKPDMVTIRVDKINKLISQLLSFGGDPCVRNHLQQTPYAASSHQDTRVAFRMFQAQYPDRYNYSKSHIPGPLTPELLEQEKERKAAQKKAKRQRDKEKQIEKAKANKFLLMNDWQKLKSTEERCFVCGAQLPKSPFEYDNFRFCTVKCLQNHRNLRPLNLCV